jgi:hypothetical protein
MGILETKYEECEFRLYGNVGRFASIFHNDEKYSFHVEFPHCIHWGYFFGCN